MVTMAAAVSRPDARSGEVPVVFAVLRDGGQSDSAALMDFLRQELEDPANMPAEVLIVDALPLTPLGKVDRVALRHRETEAAVDAVTDAVDAASSSEEEEG
jgi:fatty-acyl-CoA synthase